MSALARSASARRAFWLLLAAGGAVVAVALGAAHYMEEHGHVVTGMNNQVVWGLPHVFAIFLIVAASGALNVASVGSVFGESAYKPLAPLSVLLTVALLAGGLMVLVLDLGRPERLVVAATHYNFRSIFAWNMILYNGLFAICALYLWSLLERRLGGYSKPVGIAAFAWRVILTTGTGSIFGFLVARSAYASGLIAPLFIALSLAWGLAAFYLAQCGLARLAGQEAWDEALHARVRRLLAIFVIAALYFVAVHHMTNLYWARQGAFERFILVTGAPYPALFWIGFVGLGSVVPLVLLFHPRLAGPRATAAAALLVSLGALAFLYVFIIGGQAWPLEIFPGYEAASSFRDGQVDGYAPSLPELLLGLGGVAASFVIALAGARVLPILAPPKVAIPAAGPAK
ncbi:MAG TPA: NrfD/PsrC family molybdoenzyme membrane anchor subunit [Usitatibacteraceae bacterium]|nr:NrfD/PsrC family molybdoenzyme membrane anchor subunit [Usitatibacteraceae bacterium]